MNGAFSPSLETLIDKFRTLPGIGAKSAQRLAFYVLGMDDTEASDFAKSILDAKRLTVWCKTCANISDTEVCSVCNDDDRDAALICVVESPREIAAFERLKEYNGTYHVLHGALSPLDGIGPDKLKIRELLARINSGTVKEVILATNTNVEGEATAMYIAKLLTPLGVTVTRLAYGLPVGGELEHTDEVTLFRALEGRREIT